MCISPSMIWVERGPKWEQVPAPCDNCWRCKQNYVNDYVGRCLAEAATSLVACTISLTYAPRDDLADKVLHPHHFQLFMKRLRRAGHKVRYLVAGEYGDLKGRSHFHACLFFTYVAPPKEWAIPPRYKYDYPLGKSQADAPFALSIPQKKDVHIKEWLHGHVRVDWNMTEKAIRYVCKYLLADDKNNAWFQVSKKPPLGAAWFYEKAMILRELGVMPRSFEYLPPGGQKGKVYLMTGATRRDYLAAVTSPDMSERLSAFAWDDLHGDRQTLSEWVRKSHDKLHRARLRKETDERLKDEVQRMLPNRLDLEISYRHPNKEMIDRWLERQPLVDQLTDMRMRFYLAKMWGFGEDVEAFEGYAEQRLLQGQYLDGTPRKPDPPAVAYGQHFPGCPCEACRAGGAAGGSAYSGSGSS